MCYCHHIGSQADMEILNMPKGIPASGKRARRFTYTRNGMPIPGAPARVPSNPASSVANNVVEMHPHIMVQPEPAVKETDEQIIERINERFDILDTLTGGCIVGDAPSIIVSGPAGLGKSYTVMHALKEFDPNEVNHIIVKGFVRATGLIKTLYRFRNKGQVVVFDDADSIFFDDVALNILKAVCDTQERRTVSWLSEGTLVDDETAEVIPKHFDFEGGVIFISNYDFDDMIERGHKIAPHLKALMSRSHYINCGLKTKHDYIIRIEQVISKGMLSDLNWLQRGEVINFIKENQDCMRELSLRMAVKLGSLIKTYGNNWKKVAKVTCCR